MKRIIYRLVFLKLLLTLGVSCNFSAGSYPYVEVYKLEYSEEKVKNAIRVFKKENPEYLVPKVTINNKGSWDLKDEQTENPNHWFKIYFYYRDSDEIVFTWIQSIARDKTKFSFVSINTGLNIGNWKRVNKDFSKKENKFQKEKFEKLILSKIKENLK